MPAPISKIKLRNFKAFYGDEEVIELNGKHLLMYGENGSGKSCRASLSRNRQPIS